MSSKEEAFWCGTFCGLMCALVLFGCCMFVFVNKIKQLETRITTLESEHTELSKWVEENETIMRTYKFFNESWAAILQEERK